MFRTTKHALSILLACLVLKLNAQENLASSCLTKETCSACIREVGCIWCSKPFYSPINGTTAVRCVNEKHVNKDKWCAPDQILAPTSSSKIIQNNPLRHSKSGNAVQISPQRIQVTLRRGEPVPINFQYAQAEDYPVDLYYLMDLSASMLVHKDKLSELGELLSLAMKNLTSNFQLGFGSFVDKTEMPFVNTLPAKLKEPCKLQGKPCEPPYSFKNHMSLTEDTNRFSINVKNAWVSGNLDLPEGGFDALMQAIVCHSAIGWRPKARHLLVFSTDAPFHIAGDGKLAGIVEPNDGLCHMENNIYTHALLQDYPSVAQINWHAKENNVNIIFAVTENRRKLYTDLKDRISGSSAGILDEKSTNVVNLIKNEYGKLADTVVMVDNSTSWIELKYYSACLGTAGVKETRQCGDIRVGRQANFTTVIKVLECPANKKELKQVIEIKPQAINESLIIELNIICDCPCESEGNAGYEKKSKECSNSGDLQCGVCKCQPNRFGKQCECDITTSGSIVENLDECRINNETEVCSGLGTCKCSKCDCQKRTNPGELIYGKYCECDNFSCKRNGGQLCSGPTRGNCDCGKCVCLSGWSGEACECPDTNTTCIRPGDDTICSGHGQCMCGECQCSLTQGFRYSGKYCEECPTCPAQLCDELKHCVECQAHGSGKYDSEECKLRCTAFTVQLVDRIEENIDENNNIDDKGEKICRTPDNSGCTILFKYLYDEHKQLEVYAQKTKYCSTDVDILALVLGVIGSIVLAGLILLIIWKLVTSIHDRREYAKFDKERKMAKWHRAENPLYKTAVSTFNNPTYTS